MNVIESTIDPDSFQYREPLNGWPDIDEDKIYWDKYFESWTARDLARLWTSLGYDYYFDYHIKGIGKPRFGRRYDYVLTRKYINPIEHFQPKGLIIECDGDRHKETYPGSGVNRYSENIHYIWRVDNWKTIDALEADVVILRIDDWKSGNKEGWRYWEDVRECFDFSPTFGIKVTQLYRLCELQPHLYEFFKSKDLIV